MTFNDPREPFFNKTETIKLLDKVIKPYVERNKELNLPETQKSLLVHKGHLQGTEDR